MRNTGSGTTIRTKLKACPNIPPEDDLYTLMQMNLIENEISDSVVICESKKKKKIQKTIKAGILQLQWISVKKYRSTAKTIKEDEGDEWVLGKSASI